MQPSLVKRFLAWLRKADDNSDGSWITINGTHVHLDKDGHADEGPLALVREHNITRATSEHVSDKMVTGKLFASKTSAIEDLGLSPEKLSALNYTETKEVNPTELHATQNTVGIDKVREYLNSERKYEGTRVVNYKGKDYLIDGHHRMAAAVVSNERSIRVPYARLNDAGDKL